MKKIVKFFKECVSELKKVNWPSREVVVHSTWVVIIFTIAAGVVLGLCDTLLGLVMDLVF